MKSERFRLVRRGAAELAGRLAAEVRAGLTAERKRLPCCLFYDRDGSKLFEEICRLPEYYLTRAERAILEQHAADLPRLIDGPATLVELGSGNSEKTRLIISAFLEAQPALEYVPVDICSEALGEAAVALLEELPRLSVTAVAAEYADGLAALAERSDGPRLVLWLGSNVGNFDRREAADFLSGVKQSLRPCDRLLMGVDRRKDRATLEAAYDDASGVTAQFNLNILHRLNRDWGGTFRVEQFRHRAVYDEREGRVEMHLVSLVEQRAAVGKLDLEVRFAAGESIHTENSYKYADAEIDALLGAAGLAREAWWHDPQERFRLVLSRGAAR